MKKFMVFLKVLILLHQCLSAFMKNKFVTEVEAFQVCPDNTKTTNPIRNMNFFAYNRTHKMLSYDITYHRALDEKVGGSVTVERSGDGGWITIPFIGFQANICKYMLRFFKSFWVDFYKRMGVEHPDRCPVPKGNYSLRNYIFDATEIKLPFFSGRFRFTTRYQDVDTKEMIFCCIQIIKVTEIY